MNVHNATELHILKWLIKINFMYVCVYVCVYHNKKNNIKKGKAVDIVFTVFILNENYFTQKVSHR